MCGMSIYLISFYLDRYFYLWSEEKAGFYNDITKKLYKKVPVGAYSLEFSNFYNDQD